MQTLNFQQKSNLFDVYTSNQFQKRRINVHVKLQKRVTCTINANKFEDSFVQLIHKLKFHSTRRNFQKYMHTFYQK